LLFITFNFVPFSLNQKVPKSSSFPVTVFMSNDLVSVSFMGSRLNLYCMTKRS